jgi:hypothetical protein
MNNMFMILYVKIDVQKDVIIKMMVRAMME